MANRDKRIVGYRKRVKSQDDAWWQRSKKMTTEKVRCREVTPTWRAHGEHDDHTDTFIPCWRCVAAGVVTGQRYYHSKHLGRLGKYLVVCR